MHKIVHSLYSRVLDDVDCTECGNCCVELETCFQKDEIERLSKELKIDKVAAAIIKVPGVG